MYSHFEGRFSEREKARIERAARATDRTLGAETDGTPSWAFMHFEHTYNGFPYWGVRRKDGLMLRAKTADGLVEALDACCRGHLPRPRRAARVRMVAPCS